MVGSNGPAATGRLSGFDSWAPRAEPREESNRAGSRFLKGVIVIKRFFMAEFVSF
jgi:hypothetical protein